MERQLPFFKLFIHPVGQQRRLGTSKVFQPFSRVANEYLSPYIKGKVYVFLIVCVLTAG